MQRFSGDSKSEKVILFSVLRATKLAAEDEHHC